MKKSIIASIIAITSIAGFAQTTEPGTAANNWSGQLAKPNMTGFNSTETVVETPKVKTVPLNGAFCESVAEKLAEANGFNWTTASGSRWTYANIGGLVKTRYYSRAGYGSVLMMCPENGDDLRYSYTSEQQKELNRQRQKDVENRASSITFGSSTK